MANSTLSQKDLVTTAAYATAVGQALGMRVAAEMLRKFSALKPGPFSHEDLRELANSIDELAQQTESQDTICEAVREMLLEAKKQ